MTHFPIEFMIICAAMRQNKKTVSSTEVNAFMNTIKQPLEYNSENKLQFCTYNDKDDTYTINDNIPPNILQILAQ